LLDGGNAGVGGKEDAERINLQPQDFFDQLPGKAWAKQHSSNNDVKQVLNPRHALVAIGKRLLNGCVSFSTDGFVYGYFG
jgi:hypothetical protein